MNSYRTYGYPQQNSFEKRPCSEPCRITPSLPQVVSVAMAYIPFQECNDVYPCEKALVRGTVFPVLDKPFLAGCCR